MKWTYGIKNKMAAAGVLLTVFLLVLINNMKEQQTSSQVKDAINTIYDDRIIAQAYIFKYAQNVDRMNEVFHDDNMENAIQKEKVLNYLKDIKKVNQSFLETKLTADEEIVFHQLTDLFELIELRTRNNDFCGAHELVENTMNTLEGLTEIQVSEASHQMSTIKKLSASSYLSWYFELAVLIILGIFIQALVFSSKTLHQEFGKNLNHLN